MQVDVQHSWRAVRFGNDLMIIPKLVEQG